MSWFFFIRQRRKITIDWVPVANTRLMNDVLFQLDKELIVTWNGRRVTNPSIIEVRIGNTGNEPITAASYLRPITFRFDGVAPFTASISAVADRSINPVVSDVTFSEDGNWSTGRAFRQSEPL